MRYCTSCKKRKEWEGHQKTCPECRARVRKHMDNQRKGGMDRTAMRSNIILPCRPLTWMRPWRLWGTPRPD